MCCVERVVRRLRAAMCVCVCCLRVAVMMREYYHVHSATAGVRRPSVPQAPVQEITHSGCFVPRHVALLHSVPVHNRVTTKGGAPQCHVSLKPLSAGNGLRQYGQCSGCSDTLQVLADVIDVGKATRSKEEPFRAPKDQKPALHAARSARLVLWQRAVSKIQ